MASTAPINAEDVLTVAKTLWAEARGEGERGIRAVATVIYHRAGGNRLRFAAECKRKYQFSCWTGKTDIAFDNTSKAWKTCITVAKEMFTGKFVPETFGGDVTKPKFYCTSKLFFSEDAPKYIKNAREKGIYDEVGNHVFYNI